MEHSIENCPTFKEIEKGLFIVLQQTFGNHERDFGGH